MKITLQYWQAEYAFVCISMKKRQKHFDIFTNARQLKIKIAEGDIVL